MKTETAYRCNNCPHEFEEPIFMRDHERIDYGIGSTWVKIFEGNVCPACHSNDYEEITEEENEDET